MDRASETVLYIRRCVHYRDCPSRRRESLDPVRVLVPESESTREEDHDVVCVFVVSALPEISWKKKKEEEETWWYSGDDYGFHSFLLFPFLFLSFRRVVHDRASQNDTACSLRGHFRCRVSYRLIRTAREQRHTRGLWNYFFKTTSRSSGSRRCPFLSFFFFLSVEGHRTLQAYAELIFAQNSIDFRVLPFRFSPVRQWRDNGK